MFNIFLAVFFITLAFACLDEYFFIGYLISIAIFGLYQAIFMANAGGAWDNAKKIVEVNLREKGTPLHAATVVGDTVGDPFKDTSSVALNPIIKFTTLFGLLAVELAIDHDAGTNGDIWAAVLFAVALVFVWRSFYAMRIEQALGEFTHSQQCVDRVDSTRCRRRRRWRVLHLRHRANRLEWHATRRIWDGHKPSPGTSPGPGED